MEFNILKYLNTDLGTVKQTKQSFRTQVKHLFFLFPRLCFTPDTSPPTFLVSTHLIITLGYSQSDLVRQQVSEEVRINFLFLQLSVSYTFLLLLLLLVQGCSGLGCGWQQKHHVAAPPPSGVRRRMERNRQKLVGWDKGSLTEQQTKGTVTTTIQKRGIHKTKQTAERASLTAVAARS